MSRVKYKIWDKQENKWYVPIYEAHKGRCEDLFLCPCGELNRRVYNGHETNIEHESLFPDRYEVVLFTGLKDKNGKEIYEGDKVLVGQYLSEAIVIFERGSFYTPFNDSNYRLGGWPTEAVEVIGNIYEEESK